MAVVEAVQSSRVTHLSDAALHYMYGQVYDEVTMSPG